MKNKERHQDFHYYMDKHKVSYQLRKITPKRTVTR